MYFSSAQTQSIHKSFTHQLANYEFSNIAQPQTKQYSVKQQIEDLAVLKEALLDVTGVPFLYTSKENLIQSFDSIDAYLQSPHSARELFTAFAYLTAQVKCGHTQIFMNGRLLRDYLIFSKTLPFQVKVVGERLYALESIGHEPQLKKGGEIVSINSTSASEILEKMYELTSSDGDNITMKQHYLSDFFNFYYFVALGEQDSFKIQAISDTAEELEINIASDETDIKGFNRSYKNSVFSTYGNKSRTFGRL